jgi:hypothetical protein
VRPLFAVAVGIVASCGESVFACGDDTQCGDGVCQPEGWCSFPDLACPSGQRFGEHSGNGLAGECVDSPGSTGVGDDAGSTTLPTDDDTAPPDADGADDEDSSTFALDDGSETRGSTTHETGMSTLDDSGGTTTGNTVVLPDPIAWYSFDDPTNLLVDDSGNVHDGFCSRELFECPVPDAGAIGIAAEFAGTPQHVHVESGPWLETSTALTVAVWILPTAYATGTFQTIVAKPFALGGASWSIGLPADTVAVEASVGDGSVTGNVAVEMPDDGAWHHVALAWDGADVRLHVDGMQAGTGPAPAIAFDPQTMMFGAGVVQGADGDFHAGMLDELRIYDVALSDAEIAVLSTAR